MHSRKLLSHAQGMIKYMPIDKDAADMLTPFLDLTSKNLQPDYNTYNHGRQRYKTNNEIRKHE